MMQPPAWDMTHHGSFSCGFCIQWRAKGLRAHLCFSEVNLISSFSGSELFLWVDNFDHHVLIPHIDCGWIIPGYKWPARQFHQISYYPRVFEQYRTIIHSHTKFKHLMIWYTISIIYMIYIYILYIYIYLLYIWYTISIIQLVVCLVCCGNIHPQEGTHKLMTSFVHHWMISILIGGFNTFFCSQSFELFFSPLRS